jgi:FdhE protein
MVPGGVRRGGAAFVSTAEKREFLEKTARERPEYREILGLFRDVFSFIEGKEGETGITFAAPAAHREARKKAGLPLLSSDSVRTDPGTAARFLRGVAEGLRCAAREGTEDSDRLVRALEEGRLDTGSLFRACLARDRRAIEEAAAAAGARPTLLEFILEVPLRTALERFSGSLDPAAFGEWAEGYCPVCGGRPGMGEIAGEEGRRSLCCSGCFFKWPYKRLKCPYCGNEDPASLTYFTAGEGPVRVDVCRQCSRYIKTRDSRQGDALVPLEAEDLATLHLDLLAGKEGLERGR